MLEILVTLLILVSGYTAGAYRRALEEKTAWKLKAEVYEDITQQLCLSRDKLKADIQHARDRSKYFVDLLNALSREPFSRRKREAFFEAVRTKGLAAALVEYEENK